MAVDVEQIAVIFSSFSKNSKTGSNIGANRLPSDSHTEIIN